MAAPEQFFENVYDVMAAYEKGFVGAYSNTKAAEALRSQIKAAGGIPAVSYTHLTLPTICSV